jgi:hypothetical protein
MAWPQCYHWPNSCYVERFCYPGADGEAIAFSLPFLTSNAFRRFGATPFLGFLDTYDLTTAKVHGARRQSGLLQLITVRDTADRPAEFPD